MASYNFFVEMTQIYGKIVKTGLTFLFTELGGQLLTMKAVVSYITLMLHLEVAGFKVNVCQLQPC